MTLIDLLAAIGGALILYLLYALGSWAHATFVRGVNLAPYKARGASPHKGDGSEREGASWALVTGATDGIGLAFAHILAEEGLNVILVGRNEEKLAAVVERLSPTGATLRCIVNDAALGSVDGIAEEARQIIGDGPLTVLINNVGVGQGGRMVLHGLAERDIRAAITVNCTFPALLTHALAPLMVSSIARHNEARTGGPPVRGLIVNLSSVAALITNPLSSIYSATKAFNRQFSRALSSEYASDGIDVLCTCPGFVASSMTMMSVSPICCTARQCAQASLAKIGSIEAIPHWKHGIMYLLVRCAYALIPTCLTPTVSFKATRLFRSKSDPRL